MSSRESNAAALVREDSRWQRTLFLGLAAGMYTPFVLISIAAGLIALIKFVS